MGQLAPEARGLLEMITVTGTPLPAEVLARAVGADPLSFERALAQLRAGRLVRTVGRNRDPAVEPYHDRVREAVANDLGEEERHAHHREVALALEAVGGADPELLTTQWYGAQEGARAARYALEAAANAERALAFDRAVRLYQLALAEGAPEPRALRLKLADALANAGRGKEAADAYLAAIDGGAPAVGRELRRRAAEESYFDVGTLREGIQRMQDALADVNLKFAPTPVRAILGVLTERARLRLRGFGFRVRPADEIEPETLERIDASWGAGVALATVEPAQGFSLMARCVRLSLVAGDPRRIARSLGKEVSTLSALGGSSALARAKRLLDSQRSLALQSEDAYAQAWTSMSALSFALFRGRWKEARRLATETGDALRERCTGVDWEVITTVLVEGESGIGKSHLVRRFTDGLETNGKQAVVLFGRCYEREAVPYKALDGIVDALSRHLSRLGHDDAGALLPRHAALAAQVFPVLQRVRAFARTLGADAPMRLDPQEMRQPLFGAVREILARLSDRNALVLVIDDLQWADHDSIALLAEVLREPDAPALLLVATRRPPAQDSEARSPRLPESLRLLTLGRLRGGCTPDPGPDQLKQ